MVLQDVAPVGRSFDEYVLMFGLSENELQKSILSVADGPASFNAEMNERGLRVTSVDPIYAFTGGEIEKRYYEIIDNVIDQVRSTPGDWTWGYHRSPEHLKQNRDNTLKKFLKDYDRGKDEGRYITGELPKLGFKDKSFDIAVCSHFLFLYTQHFDYDFHLSSVMELLRVAREVRIFPLLDLMLNRSCHVEPLREELLKKGYGVEVKEVEYEMQRGGKEMMRISRPVTT